MLTNLFHKSNKKIQLVIIASSVALLIGGIIKLIN